MNKVSLVGRLTRDPEVRWTTGENQMAIARFTVAVDRKYKRDGEASADFISCKAFGKQGEFIEKYFSKGKRIGLTGRIETGSYTNKDGQKVYYTEVIAEELEFVDNKSDSGSNGNSAPANNSAPVDEFINVPDEIQEELPFN